ncbi:MAG TPA: DUF4054 domain-containing protein [Pseudolabrys sp.]|jgi:hypothetical protein|nr:DUF4054 domain-containing protein [Pseudolabrys sp.]
MATSMDDLIKILDFIAPGFAALPVEDKTMALTIAAAYRPPCLTEPQQDLAQAYYAAYILYGQQLSKAAASTPAIPAGVVMEKEGDLQRQYGKNDGTDGVGDPYGYYDNWKRLMDICGTGAIMVGQAGCGGCCGYDAGYQDY